MGAMTAICSARFVFVSRIVFRQLPEHARLDVIA